MSASNTTVDLFYATFKDAGFTWYLVIPIFIRWIVGCFGASVNLFLVYVTIKTNTLHGTCNILIASDAFCSSIYQLAQTSGLILVVTGNNFLPLSQCIYFEAIPILAIITTICIMFSVSVDRLICIVFPFWRKNLNIYMPAIYGISFAYACFVLYLCITAAIQMPDYPVMCILASDVYVGDVSNTIFTGTLIITFSNFVTYIFVWIAMRMGVYRNKKVDKTTQKVFKSLMIICCVMVFGWCSNIVSRLVLPIFRLNAIGQQIVKYGLNFLTLITLSSNTPVLYMFSNDYRRLINHYLKRDGTSSTPVASMNRRSMVNSQQIISTNTVNSQQIADI